MAIMVLQVLLGQQLLIVMEWKREHLTDKMGEGFWPTVAILVAVGLVLAIWVARTCDMFVYFASIYLDCAVLGFNQVPIIGPRSRPFALTLLMIISMAVRTLALLIPGLLGENCITHRHRQLVHGGEEHVPPAEHSRHQDEPPAVQIADNTEPQGERRPLLSDHPYTMDRNKHVYGGIQQQTK